jgi:hypothetical protein
MKKHQKNIVATFLSILGIPQEKAKDACRWCRRKKRINIYLGQLHFVMIHCKKRLAIFPSSAGMSLTKLYLAGNNLIIPGTEDGKIANLFSVYRG